MRILRAEPCTDLIQGVNMINTGHDRLEGLHLSDITKRMAFERDRKLNPDSPIDAMTLERGFTWEYVLERCGLSERHKRPGYRPEQLPEPTGGKPDKVLMSPDWCNPDDSDAQHEEWKATKKSLKRVTEHDFYEIGWHWLINTKCYLRAMARRGMIRTLVTRFRVWFINGDYSYESKSSDFHLLNDYWMFDIEHDKRELEDHWTSVLSHGFHYGLITTPPKEGAWRSKIGTPAATAAKRKSVASPALPRSSATCRVITFLATRRSSSHPSES